MSILEIIKKRRSIRLFKTDRVDKKEIEKIITAGIWAPSSGDTLPFKFLILDNRKYIEEYFSNILESVVRWKKDAARTKGVAITDLYENYKKYLEGIKNAPVHILVFLNLEKGAKDFTDGNIMNLKTNRYLYNSLRDSLFLSVQNMLLEATALGLGSLFFELPRCANTPVNTLFNIDKNFEFFISIPIGYANEENIGKDRSVKDFLL